MFLTWRSEICSLHTYACTWSKQVQRQRDLWESHLLVPLFPSLCISDKTRRPFRWQWSFLSTDHTVGPWGGKALLSIFFTVTCCPCTYSGSFSIPKEEKKGCSTAGRGQREDQPPWAAEGTTSALLIFATILQYHFFCYMKNYVQMCPVGSCTHKQATNREALQMF